MCVFSLNGNAGHACAERVLLLRVVDEYWMELYDYMSELRRA